jgi:hypothetical protein
MCLCCLLIYLFIWWDWSLNSGLQAYKAGALPLVHFAMVILEKAFPELIAWAGL